MNVVIIDSKGGNVRSVKNALDRIGIPHKISFDKKIIENVFKSILKRYPYMISTCEIIITLYSNFTKNPINSYKNDLSRIALK